MTSECLRIAIPEEDCRVVDDANLGQEDGISLSLNVIVDYFSQSCLKCAKCIKTH